MNANELADSLEKHNLLSGFACMAADMLRDQQRTIDGDKRLIDLLYKKIEQLQAQLAQAQRVYDFDNPLLDKEQEK